MRTYRYQACVDGTHKNTLALRPVADSAGSHFRVAARQIHIRIKRPLLLPVFRIRRNDAIQRSAEKKRSLDEHRRCLKGDLGFLLTGTGECSCVVYPRLLQRCDVRRCNVLKRGVTRSARIIPIGWPFDSLGKSTCARENQQSERHRESVAREDGSGARVTLDKRWFLSGPCSVEIGITG